uniref:Hexosyltransferase n=1 Tax=Rhizophora mucronata TaxID=61149 RepID=A0A2P2J173_RHIMU
MAPDVTTAAALAARTNSGLVKQASMSSRAYVTFLAGNGDYIKGVVGLAKGLKKVNSKYPLLVAILPDVPEEHRKILVSQGCIVREIKPLHPPENQTQFAMAYYVINYSKLRIWEVCLLLPLLPAPWRFPSLFLSFFPFKKQNGPFFCCWCVIFMAASSRCH